MSLVDDYKELVRGHDGDMALLYMYKSICGVYDRKDACIKLDMTMKQLAEAEEKLDRSMRFTGSSLLRALDEEYVEISVEAAETVLAFPFDALALYFLYVSMYGADDVKKAAAHLQRSEEQILELKKRLGMLQLIPGQPAERKGVSPDRTEPIPTHPVEEDPELDFDLEPEPVAEQTSDPETDRKKLIIDLAKALNIRDRTLTPLERKYICDWIELGFRDPEVAVIAYERTVKNQQTFRWAYADAIMKSWHKQQLFTPEDILEHDKRHRSTSKKSMEREAERAARKKKAGAAGA